MSNKGTKNMCRTCMSTEGELISLFSDTSDNSHLTNKIMNISDITINERDGLPYMICRKCIFLIDTFDCFKKQIESTNEKIKNIWQNANDETLREHKLLINLANFCEAGDDSDYEIQYISDEVKREVERAFRRKQQNTRKKELEEICATLQNLREIVIVPIEDIINERKDTDERNVKKVGNKANITFLRKEQCSNDRADKQIDAGRLDNSEKYISQSNSLNSCTETITDAIKFDDNDSETFHSTNPDCDERLVIETDDSDDAEQKSPEPNCVRRDELFDFEKEADNGKRNEQKTSETRYPDCNNEKEVLEPETPQEIEQKILVTSEVDDAKEIWQFKKLHDNEKTISECKNHTYMRQKVTESRHHDCDNDKENLDIEKSGNNKENSAEPLIPDSGNDAEILNTQKSVCVDNIVSQAEQPCCEHEKQATEENDTETTKPVNNESEVSETEIPNNFVENHLKPENRVFHNVEAMEIEKIHNNDENTVQSDKKEEQIIKTTNFRTNESSFHPVDKKNHGQSVDAKNLDESEKKPEVRGKERKIVKIENPQESSNILDNNVTSVRRKYDDVIVISSDSSDEERRKIYMKTANQRTSWLPRSARNKLFQSRVTTKKNHILEFQDRKQPRDDGNAKKVVNSETKKVQPRKYFQCTSCNINLYSVSSVLHHHNQIHTPAQELLSCQMCDLTFATKVILYAHFDQHVESHLFRCHYCTCEFVLKRNLRAHMNAHARTKLEEPEIKRQKIDEETRENETNVNEREIMGEETNFGDKTAKEDLEKREINC